MKGTVIDAKDCILGRMASKLAVRLLNGEKIFVVNAEKAVMTGNKPYILEQYRKRIDASHKGNPTRSPKFPSKPEAIFKRAVKGMLPRRKEKGERALKGFKTFIGMPEEFKRKEIVVLEETKNKGKMNYLTLEELSRELGAKW
ncbi:MAG: 50S ribosomal protein L13 [Candidatus Diapherotrites archaeon]